MENKIPPVFIAIPTHDFKIDERMASVVYGQSSKGPHVIVSQNSSLLAWNCNNLWCMALNKRVEYNLKWFAMVHSDVVPEPYWLDKLIGIAEEKGADLLSVVIPFKSPDGLTSTALSKHDGTGVSKRFTQTEIRSKDFPETFCAQDVVIPPGTPQKLLVNTGCMICRIDQPWSDEVFFTINDSIERRFGQYTSTIESEDWFFSRLVAEKGGKVMATKAVRVLHVGQSAFDSHQVWGNAVDPSF
jgi:hypothetical protein